MPAEPCPYQTVRYGRSPIRCGLPKYHEGGHHSAHCMFVPSNSYHSMTPHTIKQDAPCDCKLSDQLWTVVRWWRYCVLRGAGIPATHDGRWYDLDNMESLTPSFGEVKPFAIHTATFEPTNQWEQRENGDVAVVYRFQNA